MAADFSRVRFDPLRDFAGVALQQGRLLLDGDFNEYVALLDRRLRAETSDLTSFGPDSDHAGVAWVPRQTPDGFRVTASGGAVTIGRGRMYVDGLLAENHGQAPLGFDALLSGQSGTADTPYDEQPYWPTPESLPPGGPHLAYLDVWHREVTHLEDPDLVEVAVGVDTTTRLQTVWQVRLLPNVGAGACTADDDDVPGWLDVIRPSGGRLTTGTIAVDPDEDPCELPPSGGYRGLENQLYRVEIHDPGGSGTATFVWSRTNASVAMSVVEMVSTTQLRLASVGKDDVLRISTGDWVEILDDNREFNQVAGEMRRVTVDDASRTISFTGALPADLQPADADDAAARRLRVRRWDQSGVVKSGAGATLVNLDDPAATGLITVPALDTTEVVLEHGIVVSFSVDGSGGEFRAGDHWVFAARTADTSVEALDEAPPLGVHHHYARLGTLTFPDTETDCRRLWPAITTGDDCGGCTVCLTPESHSSGVMSLQGAVDLIKDTGGTICLAPGVYDIGDGVAIDQGRSLRVRGQGLTTVLVARGAALTTTRSFDVTIENLTVVSGAAAPAAITFSNVVAASLQDTAVMSYGGADADGAGSAAVRLSGVALSVGIRRNVLIGHVGIDGAGDGETGVLAAALRVEDNAVGATTGIDLGGVSAYLLSCRVTDNEVVAGQGGGIVATGAVVPGGSFDVTGNKVGTIGSGITIGADALVDANTVNGLGDQPGIDGIVVVSPGFPVEPGHVRITGNRVHDRQGAAITLRTNVRTFMVKQNSISDVGSGITIESKGSAVRAAIDNNSVVDVAPTEVIASSVLGIALTNVRSVAIAGNTVARVGLEMVEGAVRAGIVAMGCEDVRISGNVVDGVGRIGGYVGNAVGIAAVGPFTRATATDNSVRFSQETGGPAEGRWSALLLVSSVSGLTRMGAGRTVVPLGSDALVMTNGAAYLVSERADHVTVATNTVSGGGPDPTCRVLVVGDVVVEGNQCSHFESGEPLAMVLAASSVAAASNRIRGGEAMLVLEVSEERFSATGNLAPGGTHLGGPGAGLPAPWDALNPKVS